MLINVLEYLENTAKKLPDKPAFVDEKGEYTYSELELKAKNIGSTIASYSYRNRPVIIYLDKGIKVIASFMGILYSGNFYSPIDTGMPLERAKTIISVATPPIIITDLQRPVVIFNSLKNKFCCV